MANQQQNSVSGILEIPGSGGGLLRDPQRNYTPSPQDPTIPRDWVERYRLKGGEGITVALRNGGRSGPMVDSLVSIMGQSPGMYAKRTLFDDLTVISPDQALRFETKDGPPTTRVLDLLAPIGKGQRGLIVAPPRTGKTVLLKQLAHGIRTNHPEVLLMMLLVDERPEEVTEMRRFLCENGGSWEQNKPEVVYSSNDYDAKRHARIARLMIEKAKRYLECGREIVILLDSLTRLGRAFNNLVGSSGRTMTGGLDIRALEIPKQIFGAARKIEHAGSLTIIASALIETGSRMDEFIFQEFKGTGNMEMVLSRDLANQRIWPALDLSQSGTRKEELLLGAETLEKMARLRRRLISMPPAQQMQTLLGELARWPSNAEFLASLAS